MTQQRAPYRPAVLAGLLLALYGCDEPLEEEREEGTGPPAAAEVAPDAETVDGSPADDAPIRPPADASAEPGTVAGGETGGDAAVAADDAPDGAMSDETSAGTPGTTDGAADADVPVVDCAGALPCRAALDGGALAVTLAASDGEALDGSGALRVDFAVEALARDATLALGSGSSAVVGGQVLGTASVSLGGAGESVARDEAVSALLAGVAVNAHVVLDGRPFGNPAALERLTLVLAEGDSARVARFANVPLGPERSEPVDCAATLPCAWRSSDGGVTLTLVSAEPARWNRSTRLAIDWTLETTRPLEAMALPSYRVVAEGGATLEPYGIELAGLESRDGTPLAAPLDADAALGGRLVLRRMPPEETGALARVEPAVIERRALRTPRWRAVFVDVPVTR